jgi:hypothetical protein
VRKSGSLKTLSASVATPGTVVAMLASCSNIGASSSTPKDVQPAADGAAAAVVAAAFHGGAAAAEAVAVAEAVETSCTAP